MIKDCTKTALLFGGDIKDEQLLVPVNKLIRVKLPLQSLSFEHEPQIIVTVKYGKHSIRY